MTSPPHRRWHQFSVRSFLIVTGLLSWAAATQPFVVERTTISVVNERGDEYTIVGDPAEVLSDFRDSGDTFVNGSHRRYRALNPQLWPPACLLMAYLAWSGYRRSLGCRPIPRIP